MLIRLLTAKPNMVEQMVCKLVEMMSGVYASQVSNVPMDKFCGSRFSPSSKLKRCFQKQPAHLDALQQPSVPNLKFA